jgi:hypothetical protein
MSIAASGETTERLDIGQALQDVLNVVLRNLLRLALLGLVLAGVPHAFLNLSNAYAEQYPIFILPGLLGLIAAFVTRPILFGAVIFMTVRELDGQPASLRECVAAGRRRWGSLLGLMIVSGLAIGVGLVLLIVPGVYLALRWAVAGPSKVLTGRGISDAMAHSATLTEGRRWTIFLLYAVVYVVLIVLALLFGAIGYVLNSAPKYLIATVIGPLPTVCLDLTLAVVTAVLYRHLRGDAEGPPTGVLVEVFA